MTTTKTELATTMTTTTAKPKETTTTGCMFQRWKSGKQQGGSQPCGNQRQPAAQGEHDDHHGDGEYHHDDHGKGEDDDNDRYLRRSKAKQ